MYRKIRQKAMRWYETENISHYLLLIIDRNATPNEFPLMTHNNKYLQNSIKILFHSSFRIFEQSYNINWSFYLKIVEPPLTQNALLTHRGRVTHICVGKHTIIVSDNGLSPGRRQAIIWTNAGILLIGPLWTNFSEILIEILTFSFAKMRLKWRPFFLGPNVF